MMDDQVPKPNCESKTESVGIKECSRKTEESSKRTVEGALIGDVVYEEDAHGTAVVGGGDGTEALLAGGVPDLQLNALSIELNGPDLEVDADSGDEGRGEGVFAEAQQAARLADAGVAY